MQDTLSHQKTQSPIGLVSFIIPYYNVPVDMLKECLDSILALSLQPDEREIIIVDDGSDNAVIEALSEYQSDIIYVRQKNSGTSVARNRGISVSSGNYIQFVDADDKLLTATYEHCLDIIRLHKADMVAFHATQEDKTERAVEMPTAIDGTTYMRYNNIKGSVCCYLIERKTLGDLRFRDNTYHEDEELTPQLLLKAEQVYATSYKAYFYRQRPESRMHEQGVKKTLQRLQDNEQVIANLYLMASTGPKADREALERRAAQLTMDYLYNLIIETRSIHYLERCVERLHQKGFFPLPHKKYTTKYQWFRAISSTKIGRKALIKLLPKIRE